MIQYNGLEKRLKRLGYSKDLNISDFWFSNKNTLRPKLFGNHHDSRFDSIIRWKSEIGIECQKSIKKYIEDKIWAQEEINRNELFSPEMFDLELSDKNFKHVKIDLSNIYVTIDFKDFSFEFNGKEYDLDDFEYLFPLKRTQYKSLNGVDLGGISLKHCVFKNCSFSNANFDNSYLSGVIFDFCNLSNCSFKNSTIAGIRLNKTIINGNFKGASLSGINPFDKTTIRSPFKIHKISYFSLLSYSISTFKRNWYIKFNKHSKHTHFIGVITDELNSNSLSQLKKYIDWYQNCIESSTGASRDTFWKKLFFFLSVLFTKDWTSLIVLAIWFLIYNLLSGLVLLLNSCHFENTANNFNPDYLQSMYHCLITFSILGYGDISPIDTFGRAFIMIQAITGYIILGLFIYLLSRKINDKV